MAGLDDISLAIGEMRAELRGLGAAVRTNRKQADKRHADNVTRLDKIGTRIEGMEATLTPVVKDVADMKPQVKELMTFKVHTAAIIGVAVAIVWGALLLIWQAIIHFGDVRSFFSRLFH
jgi:Protein of unknown function (DUF1515)